MRMAHRTVVFPAALSFLALVIDGQDAQAAISIQSGLAATIATVFA